MSEADRYFIKKGFSKVIKQGIEEFTDDDGNYIHFDLVIERFTCNCYLSAKELQAINKKVEELRMDMSNKTSDKNVANIEELIQEYKTYNDLDGIQDLSIYVNALEHILAEREQDKKRIQELEEKMNADNMLIIYELKQKDKRIQELEEENKRKDMFVEMAKEVIENSILKQTIIDKVKENKQILDRTNDGNLRERLYIENDILQELLEGEKH